MDNIAEVHEEAAGVPVSLAEQLRDARAILQRIVTDLPQRRDWLDPDVEKAARNFLATPVPEVVTCGFCHEPMDGGPRCSHCGAL
jgi:hypothetical protein